MPYLSTEQARRNGASANERERPLALTRPVGASLVIEQACPYAQQLGVRPGMSLGQAQAIVPHLQPLAYEPQRERETLERLANRALRFSPIVEPVEPNTLLVDITGCQRLFGSEESIAHQAADWLTQAGFYSRAAIADTVGAAYALATAGIEPLTLAAVGQASASLASLPPSALRIEPQVSTQLEAVGVRSIGDLLTLPRNMLPARFGSELVLRLQQALGEVFEGVTPHVPKEAPTARLSFEHAVTEPQAILSVAEQLLTDVFAQMKNRGQALRRLACVLSFESTRPRVFSIELARASREQPHVAQLLRQRLERVDPAPGITGLVLRANETSRFCGEQTELFEPRDPGDDEALGCLIDRLANRLGYDAVVRPRLVNDHQPEKAFWHVSVAEAGCESQNATSETHPSDSPVAPSMRPVRLLPRPLPIRVIALVPDGPPTWFAYRGQECPIAQAWGPERLETAWWRGSDVRRDYFRVATDDGEQFWIFHAANERRWYLHGLFA